MEKEFKENKEFKFLPEKLKEAPNFKKRRMVYYYDGERKEKNFIVAVIVDFYSGENLMQAFMDRDAWDRTIKTGFVHFWSFSRDELWFKGETSGNKLLFKSFRLDCDSDCVEIKVEVLGEGNVCHKGQRSCFS